MEEKLIDLLVSVTGLEKEFVVNSMKNDEGSTIVLNQFKEKNKVFKKEDFELREKNLKDDHNSTYLNELIELAKNQKLPTLLYNAAANNIISSQNKKLATDLGIEIEDYTNSENFVKSVKEKLSTVDNKQLQTDFDELQMTVKQFDEKFETQEATHVKEMKQNKIDIAYASALNKFQQRIDYETDEELKSRTTVADSVFKSNFVHDLEEGKEIVKDSEGNILKNETTKEALNYDAIFDTEISKYVPMKKERSKSDRNNTDAKITDGTKITREMIDKQIESGDVKPHSKDHIDLERKLVDQE